MSSQRSVLITGCSNVSLGEGLALAFHKRGLKVFATSRDPSKMSNLTQAGIETMRLDVLSPSSIAECAALIATKTRKGSLDILINNAGAAYVIPLVDTSLDQARHLFEVNVLSIITVTQAFLPLLLKSHQGGLIINQTSIGSVLPVVMSGVYAATKAAAASLTENLRLELAPFNIKVVDLKSGGVKSRLLDNLNMGAPARLPRQSIYAIAREEVETKMSGEWAKKGMTDTDVWAEQVVGDLLQQPEPALRIWRGSGAWTVWFARRFLPYNWLDGILIKNGALDVVRKRLGEKKEKGNNKRDF